MAEENVTKASDQNGLPSNEQSGSEESLVLQESDINLKQKNHNNQGSTTNHITNSISSCDSVEKIPSNKESDDSHAKSVQPESAPKSPRNEQNVMTENDSESPSSADNHTEKPSTNTSETISEQSSLNFEENTATHEPHENQQPTTDQISKQPTSTTNSTNIETSTSSIPTLKTDTVPPDNVQEKTHAMNEKVGKKTPIPPPRRKQTSTERRQNAANFSSSSVKSQQLQLENPAQVESNNKLLNDKHPPNSNEESNQNTAIKNFESSTASNDHQDDMVDDLD